MSVLRARTIGEGTSCHIILSEDCTPGVQQNARTRLGANQMTPTIGAMYRQTDQGYSNQFELVAYKKVLTDLRANNLGHQVTRKGFDACNASWAFAVYLEWLCQAPFQMMALFIGTEVNKDLVVGYQLQYLAVAYIYSLHLASIHGPLVGVIRFAPSQHALTLYSQGDVTRSFMQQQGTTTSFLSGSYISQLPAV